MKITESQDKKMTEEKYNLVGNCVHGLDDPYFRDRVCYDATEMAGIVDEFSNVFLSSDEFIQNVNWPDDLMGLPADNIYEFAYNPYNDIYWAYNIEDDIHYFFVKDSINENYKDTITVKSIKLFNILEDMLSESQLNKVLIEQGEETSDQTCSKSKSSYPGAFDKWNSLDNTTKKAKMESIKSDIRNLIGRCVNEYNTWFSNPKTVAKFKTEKEKNVVKQIPSFLNTIKDINLSVGGPGGRNTVIAWVSRSNMTTINYNLAMIHNTEKYIGSSMYEITKHEMGHLIDYFFAKNGVKTYIETIDTTSQQDYQDNYLINDRDQYARLSYLRQLVGAGPADSGQVLLVKFLKRVEDGTVTSSKFNMSGIKSKIPKKTKNDIDTAKLINSKIGMKIMVKGKPSLNLDQLFSTFAIMNGNDIWVSFDLVAQLNYTSKDAERVYYYLKLSPK